MGRVVIVFLLGAIFIFGIYVIISSRTAKFSEIEATNNYRVNFARNIALSTVDILLSRLADSTSYRVNQEQSLNLMGGSAEFTIIDTILGSDSLIQIRVRASYEGIEKQILTYVKFTGGFVPPTLRGAITANANLSKTISDMIIDGRDHDLNGNLIPGNGIYGVSSGTTFTNLQGAMIGGTVSGVDYPPKYPEYPRVIE